MNAPQHRFLICRHSAIGDVVHALPLVEALHEKFPNAPIAWVVESRASQLLEHHPKIHELIVLPKNWRRSPAKIFAVRKRLRKFQATVSIDVQGLTKSSLTAWLSGAKTRIGFADEKGRGLSKRFNNLLCHTTKPHIVDANLELLKPIGIEPGPATFHIAELPSEKTAAKSLLSSIGIDHRFAIINVGAGWKSKLWPREKYAQVSDYLQSHHQLQVLILWAGEAEFETAQWIQSNSPKSILAPKTTLRELASISRLAEVFIGSDTGPLHIAVAVGTRCIGLFGPMDAQRNGPYGSRNIAIQKATYDGHRSGRRSAPSSIMDAIQVEDVCQACRVILASN